MQDRFTRTDPGAWWNLMLVLALLGCLLGVAYLLNRCQQRRAGREGIQPMGLFLRVQRQLGLSLRDRWRLWRLAGVLNIEHPTALLISARLYDETVKHYCAGRGWFKVSVRTVHHFASIRRRLFQADE